MRNFLKPAATASIKREAEDNQHLAYYTANTHNIYLTKSDPEYPADHPRNHEVSSSKGCITRDQISAGSALQRLYNSPAFREFLCAVLGEKELHEYADALSSINFHLDSLVYNADLTNCFCSV